MFKDFIKLEHNLENEFCAWFGVCFVLIHETEPANFKNWYVELIKCFKFLCIICHCILLAVSSVLTQPLVPCHVTYVKAVNLCIIQLICFHQSCQTAFADWMEYDVPLYCWICLIFLSWNSVFFVCSFQWPVIWSELLLFPPKILSAIMKLISKLCLVIINIILCSLWIVEAWKCNERDFRLCKLMKYLVVFLCSSFWLSSRSIRWRER